MGLVSSNQMKAKFKYHPLHSAKCCAFLGRVPYLGNSWAIFKCYTTDNAFPITTTIGDTLCKDMIHLSLKKRFVKSSSDSSKFFRKAFKLYEAAATQIKPKAQPKIKALNVKKAWKNQFRRKIKVMVDLDTDQLDTHSTHGYVTIAAKRPSQTKHKRSNTMDSTSTLNTGTVATSDAPTNTSFNPPSSDVAVTSGVTAVTGASVTTPKAKRGPTMIRLSSGEVVARKVGRLPVGAVVLGANGEAITEPVVSKAKPKTTFIKLPDGTVKVRSRGRPQKGSTPCDANGNPLS